MLKVEFFSRKDCPLCDDIEEKLYGLNCDFVFIDIDLDSKLKNKYHVKIPVLRSGSRILEWPFTDIELEEFIEV